MRSAVATTILLAGALALGGATLMRAASEPQPANAAIPAFLQANRCYRFGFGITNAPSNWKVLELAQHGWLKTQVDAGPASSERETVWVNTAQVITVREARCSD
jgi:hypothetical protein